MHAASKEEEPEPCVSALFLKLFFFLSPRAVCVFPVFSAFSASGCLYISSPRCPRLTQPPHHCEPGHSGASFSGFALRTELRRDVSCAATAAKCGGAFQRRRIRGKSDSDSGKRGGTRRGRAGLAHGREVRQSDDRGKQMSLQRGEGALQQASDVW